MCLSSNVFEMGRGLNGSNRFLFVFISQIRLIMEDPKVGNGRNGRWCRAGRRSCSRRGGHRVEIEKVNLKAWSGDIPSSGLKATI